MRPSMARLTLARKIAAITLIILEERSEFRPKTVAATNRLSIPEEEPSIRRVSSASGRSNARDARFEGSISQ